MRTGLRPVGLHAVVLYGVVAWLALGGAAAAQRVNLTVTPKHVSFPSADPDAVPVVTAQPLTVRYQVRGNGNQAWRLTVLAAGDFADGGAAIDVGNVSWTATPSPPFQAGTLSSTVEQTVASGAGDVQPPRSGTLVFQMNNLWTYNVGVYTQTIVFTLSAP